MSDFLGTGEAVEAVEVPSAIVSEDPANMQAARSDGTSSNPPEAGAGIAADEGIQQDTKEDTKEDTNEHIQEDTAKTKTAIERWEYMMYAPENRVVVEDHGASRNRHHRVHRNSITNCIKVFGRVVNCAFEFAAHLRSPAIFEGAAAPRAVSRHG